MTQPMTQVLARYTRRRRGNRQNSCVRKRVGEVTNERSEPACNRPCSITDILRENTARFVSSSLVVHQKTRGDRPQGTVPVRRWRNKNKRARRTTTEARSSVQTTNHYKLPIHTPPCLALPCLAAPNPTGNCFAHTLSLTWLSIL